MKKLLCFVAAAALVFSAASLLGCGSAEVQFTLSEDGGHYIVSGVSGNKFALTEYDIPSSYDDGVHGLLPVGEIGEEAFMYCSLYTVTIPDSVTSIGDRAFAYTKIAELDIPDSVEAIGYAAFAYCSALTGVVVPSSVTVLGGFAFAYCSSLASAVVEANITVLEAGTFSGILASDSSGVYTDTALTSLTLPSSLKKISRYAYADNTFITDIYFGGTYAEWDKIEVFYMTSSDEGEAEEVVLSADERNLHFSAGSLKIHCTDADVRYSYVNELQPDNSYKIVGETIVDPV